MPKPGSKALSTNHARSSWLGGCIAVVVCAMFLIVGSIFLYIVTIRPLWGVLSARNWVETPCRIVSSEVEVHRNDGDTYRAKVVYTYTFGGREYTGDRSHFMGHMSSSGRKGKQKIVDQYPAGAERVCYVDPADPGEAVLTPGLTADMWWGLFPLPFVLIGGGGLFYAIFGARKSGDGASLATSTAPGRRAPAVDLTAAGFEDDGPAVLRPETSPFVQFVLALFFASFWNGIVSLFVYQAWESFQRGRPEWFLTLFLTPFVAIGAGLLVWVLYAFAALFNPRPVLTLSRRRIPLGGAAELAWTFSGNSGAVRRLTIALEGEEQATYRRGTDTHTDEHTFYRNVLLETEDPLDISEGRVEFSIPADSMHSFTADNNKLVWSISVAGEIPLRPDVKTTFPIQVIPHELAD